MGMLKVGAASLLLALAACGSADKPEPRPAPPVLPAPPVPVDKSDPPISDTPSVQAFEYEFNNFTPGDPDFAPPLPATVFVKIKKDDPEFGPVSWSKIHKEGSVLGWVVEPEGATAWHTVFSAKAGKSVRVNFDTGETIARILTDKIVPHKTQHCPILTRPLVRCPGPEGLNSPYRVNEIHLRNRSGIAWTVVGVSGPAPWSDTLCAFHGGKGEDPRWTEDQLKAARSQEAEEILFRADAGWSSKNPAVRTRSRDAYRQLLKDFGATEVVRSNQARIKPRSEAEIED